MKTQIYLIRCNSTERKLAARLLAESPLPQDYRTASALFNAIPVDITFNDLIQAADYLPPQLTSVAKKLKRLAKAISKLEA